MGDNPPDALSAAAAFKPGLALQPRREAELCRAVSGRGGALCIESGPPRIGSPEVRRGLPHCCPKEIFARSMAMRRSGCWQPEDPTLPCIACGWTWRDRRKPTYTSNMISTKNLESTQAVQFQALADPVRLQIVTVLERGPRCVCEIQSAIGPIAGNLLSYHLGILRNAGLVSAQRRGRWLDYRLEYEAFATLRATLPQPGPDAHADAEAEGESPRAGSGARPTRCARRPGAGQKVSAPSGRCG